MRGDSALLVGDAAGLSPAMIAVGGPRVRRIDLSFDWSIGAFTASHPWWRLCREMNGLVRLAARSAGAELEPPEPASTQFHTWSASRWKDLLVRGLPVQSAPVLVAGVDTILFRPVERVARGGGPTLLYYGPVSRKGGLGTVFLAMQRLRSKVRLRIVAGSTDSAYLAELAELARAAAVTDRIEVVPAEGESQRASLLASADAFVHPFERVLAFPRGALEAMSAGVPVVAATGSGSESWFRDSETVSGFPPGDPVALAQALDRVLAASDAQAAMTRTARADVVRRFGASFTVDQLEPLLSE